MQNPAFPKELHALSLANYILTRIRHHADIYKDTAAPYGLSKNDEVLFLVCYLLMSLHLQEGNTMLQLDDNGVWFNNNLAEQDEWGLSEHGFVGWQFELIKKLLPMLDIATGETYQSFGADVAMMMSLPSHALKEFVQTKINETTAKAYTLSAGDRVRLGEFVRLLFGFVYVCHYRFGGKLRAFYEHLKSLPFFEDKQGDRQSAKRIFVLSPWQAGFRLWLTRSFLAEEGLAKDIKRLLSAVHPPINDTPNDKLNAQQKEAVWSALTNSFTIITGGPGTGKTYTVGQLVIELLGRYSNTQNGGFRLALVAPTGKAAQRMQESLQKAVGDEAIRLPDAMTIHRLLGMGVDGVPRYDKDSQLPFDMVVVDEASMLGVELAQKLLSAISTGTRLILLGDANQLAAVDAGAVLGDLCGVEFLKKNHKKLTNSTRFTEDSAVGQVAKLIQDKPNAQTLITLLKSNQDLDFVNVEKVASSKTGVYEELAEPFLPFFEYTKTLRLGSLDATQKQQVIKEMFEILNHYRILTASHQGSFGDVTINDELSKKHFAYQNPNTPTPAHMYEWYHGRVVMITKNSYDLGLFNGDIGVCVNEYHKGERHSVVYFDGKQTGVPIAMLPSVMITTAYAMTIHKSQGSEFEKVAVCFDDSNARLLGQELLYTGVTRAKKSVVIYATPSAIERAITQKTQRQTGLSFVFEQLGKPYQQDA